MPIRYYAQRKHIISSLDTLLYQLHTLSYLLSPTLLPYFFRCATQFQFARARDLDGSRSLGFWFFIIGFVNLGSVWSHALGGGGGSSGRNIVLDFVGMGRRSTKTQLLLLDFTIMFLQALLTSISYETSLTLSLVTSEGEEVEDELAPSPPSSTSEEEENSRLMDLRSIGRELQHSYPPSPLPSPSPSPSPTPAKDYLPPPLPPAEPVIVVTLQQIVHRLRSAVPTPPDRPNRRSMEELLSLPLPNTTSARRLQQTFRLLAQTRPARMRSGDDIATQRGAERRNSSGSRVPGAIDIDGL